MVNTAKQCQNNFLKTLLCSFVTIIVVPCAVRAEAVVIKLVGVPQPKPLHGFSPNFQGMFIPRGSRAD